MKDNLNEELMGCFSFQFNQFDIFSKNIVELLNLIIEMINKGVDRDKMINNIIKIRDSLGKR